ncbi:Transcriptional regulator, contains XRE-family HTH domain [Jannaschia seohaensis]|uniref:Transcriptional regulator with XRE-family HTH domain n=2 Tax=Jannaschia seohaensis TaxID=475081 RepID=A0A2Y9A2B8_9RHOB|nr:transcriptional regulator with XRE-family HTH domain [Jannaschia seohaensis]SSA36629.1 Transcriptional regulator, contains XRE-family HTH domain [Jannaschia seohaensis]
MRTLREARGLTLAAVAERSGISRATLSRIENGDTSPTAETLGRLAAVYALPISRLLAPLEQDYQPVVKRDQQLVWRDEEHSFTRRSVSPSNGQLSLELIECELGQKQTIRYAAPAVPGQEHHLYLLSGRLEVTVERHSHSLMPGDCLRYVLFGETVFRTAEHSCKYVIALR